MSKRAAVLVALAFLALFAPGMAPAQQLQDVNVLSSGGSGPDLELPRSTSLFNIGAFGDEGSAGVRTNGSNAWCFQNIVGFASRNNFGCRTGWYVRDSNGSYRAAVFDYGMKWAAPPSDLPDVINPVESGLKGGGWTVNMTTLIIGGAVRGGGDKLWASDRTSAQLLAIGVNTREDASCQNHSAIRDGNMDAGFQLTPTSDCTATHPPSGWGGRHPVPIESYLELQATHPDFSPALDGDPFAFWRVPEELQRTDKFFGDWQTYGELSDFYLNALGRYGSVIPGGSGAPNYEGWPLGLTQFYDVFYFGLPTVGNVVYFQSTIVNESEKVYGVGMTYDSVYIGMNIDPLLVSQADAHYFDPKRSAFLHKDTGNRCAGNPDPPGSGCGSGTHNWSNGAPGGAYVVLKSPIGDLRYKLFTDPTSPFFDPSHPRAGDTITFQHLRQCGFGDCIPRTWSRSQRAHFGLFTSTGINVLDGEQPGDLTDRQYHRIFRPEAWPDRTGQFNKYIPGVNDSEPVWDWNHDGLPDTIYVDPCGSRGCVALWSDTLPSGYTNNYGNISDLAVGPVHMEPYDTVAWVVAVVGAADSITMETTVNNAIDFYNRFYLGPESAPAPRITAVDVVGGQAFTGGNEPGNSITLFFDDTSEEWVDPFLATVDVAAELALNPWLGDSIAARRTDNVAALHIFKSCDGGSTFTNDGDCDGDPVQDPTSKWSGFGWQPYQTFTAGPGGSFPNVFTDNNINPGVTYTYSIVTETRGAVYNLVRSGTGVLSAELVTFAPSLLGSLSASATNPNVAVVYAPLNLAAGARAARLTQVSRAGKSTVPVNFQLIGSAPTSGDYRAFFGDSIQLTQIDNLDEKGAVVSSQSTVTAWVLRTVTNSAGSSERVAIRTETFSRSGTVTPSGLTQTSSETTATQRTTVWDGGFGMVLATGSTPLLATTTLTGPDATPGTFLGRSDFPFFTVSVNRGAGGSFNREVFTTPVGDTLSNQVAPSVIWRTGGAFSSYLSGGQYGTFALAWSGRPFGPSSPFRIGSQLVSSFESSMASRISAGSSSTSADDLEAVKAADPSVTIGAGDLVAYSLPFSVRNISYDRDVSVLVTSHQNTLLLGQANDSVRVTVPAGQWVPGDVLYFVETINQEVRDANGNTVLGPDGQPQTSPTRVATFKVVLGCLAPRPSCDPTIGGALQSGYIPTDPGTSQLVDYLVPLSAGDEVVINVQRAVTALEARASGAVSLDNVHVVPNPYLFVNAFERATDQRVLKFTNLPPEGRIRIFDVAGRFIQEINYTPDDLTGSLTNCGATDCGGDLNWNMQTRETLELASGLYIFVLESEGQRKMGKFVVIR